MALAAWAGRAGQVGLRLPAVVDRRALLGARAHRLAEVLGRHQARQLWPHVREGRRLTILFVAMHWRRDLSQDALWLTGLLCRLLPTEPEPLGLLALMRLHLARADARFTDTGDLVRLADQDRSLWDHDAIQAAVTLIERAAAMHRPGPYQVEAAIAACHAEAPSFESTDWIQVVALYDLLLEMEPSPVVRLNRALAIWRVAGAQAALRELDRLAAELDGYHIYHAARGELLSEMGRDEQARAARLQAHDLTHNQAERALLRQRLLL